MAGLAAAETECCSFFTFALTATGGALSLDVTVPAAHTAILDALAGLGPGLGQSPAGSEPVRAASRPGGLAGHGARDRPARPACAAGRDLHPDQHRIAALYEVMAAAAGSGPRDRRDVPGTAAGQAADQRILARSLARHGALRSGLREARATDIIWALANPRTHHALVGERRWSPDEYQRWLADLLASALLREPAG